MKKLSVSYSAVQSWRNCEQQYWYRYVDKIQPKAAAAPLELGTLIHNYMETFYGGDTPATAEEIKKSHKLAMKGIRKDTKGIKRLAKITADLGQEEQGKELLQIPETAKHLMRAYYRVHGQYDLEEHRVIMAEQWFTLDVTKYYRLPGKIDMVTETDDGYWLWEHKTTGNVPRATSRFRDLQTLLYAVALEDIYSIKPVGIIWNYIHTRPPHPPQLLKNGTLSLAQNQTTTVGLYKAAIKEHDQQLKPYRPFLRKLEAKERTDMFPRYQIPVTQDARILLRDYATSVEQIDMAIKNKDYYQPVRNITQQCEWCWREGTKITMAVGPTKKIEDVHVGEELLAYAPRKGTVSTEVTRIFTREVSELVKISTDRRPTEYVYVTLDHPFLVKGKWKFAKNIKVGDILTELSQYDKVSLQMSRANPMYDKRTAQKVGKSHRGQTRTFTEEHKKKISVAKKRNGSEQAFKARQATRRITPLEQEFIATYKEAGLPVKFVGDGTFWVGRRNPDFVVIGKEKKVIEVMHGGERRIVKDGRRRDLERSGYKLLVVSASKLPKDTIEEVWQFVHNGATVKWVETVSNLYGDKPLRVYNLECAPYPNYYGNGILGHNCPFKKLCHAVVTGGDTDVLMEKYFTDSERKGGTNGSQEEEDNGIKELLEDD